MPFGSTTSTKAAGAAEMGEGEKAGAKRTKLYSQHSRSPEEQEVSVDFRLPKSKEKPIAKNSRQSQLGLGQQALSPEVHLPLKMNFTSPNQGGASKSPCSNNTNVLKLDKKNITFARNFKIPSSS